MIKVPLPLFDRLRDIAIYAARLDKVELGTSLIRSLL
jgi:hypothetical protein